MTLPSTGAAPVPLTLGDRFEVRAINVGESFDIKGVEGRPSPPLQVLGPVDGEGVVIALRIGVIVLFGVPVARHEALIESLAAKIRDRYDRFEWERATVRKGDSDSVEPDALVIAEVTIERLAVIAEVLGKSVVLARDEIEVAKAFPAIEPLALQMSETPRRLRFKQADLVRQIGDAILVQHHLVGQAAVLEKPDIVWESPALDRFYTRLEDEYELRERHLALERKLGVMTSAAQMMLELHQTRRSYKVEWYIVGLILFEIVFGFVELALKR